ncbi:hypothetical protein FGE05_20545 [Pseudomonas sp. ICMP22404]|nr:hypothetical protein FGE05_20545 [Pseudomonas sp. ICMP22404]
MRIDPADIAPHVGASLLAIAVVKLASTLDMQPPARAGSLPQENAGTVDHRSAEKPLSTHRSTSL